MLFQYSCHISTSTCHHGNRLNLRYVTMKVQLFLLIGLKQPHNLPNTIQQKLPYNLLTDMIPHRCCRASGVPVAVPHTVLSSYIILFLLTYNCCFCMDIEQSIFHMALKRFSWKFNVVRTVVAIRKCPKKEKKSSRSRRYPEIIFYVDLKCVKCYWCVLMHKLNYLHVSTGTCTWRTNHANLTFSMSRKGSLRLLLFA